MSDIPNGTVLVVGATGQVGGVVVSKLANQNRLVRALARPMSDYEHLKRANVEIVFGDLMDPQSLANACSDVDLVIATATAHIPRFPKDDFRLIDDIGYVNLIEACRQQGVSRLVFCSGITTPHDDWIPLMKFKRRTEARIMSSGLTYTIVRASAFMDVAFVLMGSSLPLVGAQSATVKRPFRFARKHIDKIENSIEKDHVAHIPGNGKTRHSFISGANVADFLINAGMSVEGRNAILEVGGPEELSWFDVIHIYEDLLGINLRAKFTPAVVFRNLSRLFSLFSAPASNLMAINYLFAATNAIVDGAQDTARRFDVKLTTASDFLKEKLAQRSQKDADATSESRVRARFSRG